MAGTRSSMQLKSSLIPGWTNEEADWQKLHTNAETGNRAFDLADTYKIRNMSGERPGNIHDSERRRVRNKYIGRRGEGGGGGKTSNFIAQKMMITWVAFCKIRENGPRFFRRKKRNEIQRAEGETGEKEREERHLWHIFLIAFFACSFWRTRGGRKMGIDPAFGFIFRV